MTVMISMKYSNILIKLSTKVVSDCSTLRRWSIVAVMVKRRLMMNLPA